MSEPPLQAPASEPDELTRLSQLLTEMPKELHETFNEMPAEAVKDQEKRTKWVNSAEGPKQKLPRLKINKWLRERNKKGP